MSRGMDDLCICGHRFGAHAAKGGCKEVLFPEGGPPEECACHEFRAAQQEIWPEGARQPGFHKDPQGNG